MNGQIGLVFNGVWSHYAVATAPKYASIFRLVYVHELPVAPLDDLDALVIPFQSHQPALERNKDVLYRFLAQGRKIAIFGDSTAGWLDAQWEDRPVNNYWWVEDPRRPPITQTDDTHPVFAGLQPRHACWHVHGVYTQVPPSARVIQRNDAGEIITWQTHEYGGTLFVSTLDPIVEHGVQQIRHLDNFVDSLTAWLCGVRPQGPFVVPSQAYGVSDWRSLTASLPSNPEIEDACAS